MTVTRSEIPPIVNKLAGLAVVIVGFLILASGYRYDSSITTIVGGLVLATGIVMLVLKIARRNRDDTA